MVDPLLFQKFAQKLQQKHSARNFNGSNGPTKRPPPLRRSKSSPSVDGRGRNRITKPPPLPSLKTKLETVTRVENSEEEIRRLTSMLSFDKLTKSVDNKSGDLDLNSLNSDLSKVPTEFAMKDDASNLSPSPTNNGTCMFTFLRKVPILSDLNEKQLELLGVALKREKYENGDRIITQGEHGVKFFFLLNGHVVVNQRTFKGAKEVVRKVNEYCTGDYFGEGALLQDAPRMADVVAVENCTCLSLHRDDFHHILGDVQTEMETQFRARVLNGVDLLANLTDEERYEIAAALVVETFEDGESIITQGEMGNKFYMIKEGEVLFTRTESDDNMETAKDNPAKDNPAKDNPAKDNNTVAEETDNNNVDEKKPEGSPKQTKKKEPKEIGRFFAGQSFGEGSLLTEAPRRANALAVGKVTVLSLERDAFSRVFNESLQDMLNKDYNTRVVHSSGNMETMKFENLETLLLLGTGTYGKVFLVTHKVTGGTYALKCMEKSRIIKLEQQEHVKNEKRILTEIKHPFVVDLVQTFVGPNYVYALLEAVLGGELFSLMREAGRFKLKPALFYIAQLVLVLKHLHSHNIVYRDLKPENLMLSAKGYLKMTDFGLAKQLNVHAGETKTYTLCGTPCYAAPEIYNLSGHGPPVDWWALGVLTHEILSGITPFTGDAESIFATMYAYGRAYPNIKLPAGLNGHSGDFVLRLLHPNPNKRLGGRDCKAHKLLRKINWTRILQQEATAPYVPKIDSLYDTRNFYHRQDKNGADEILDEVMDDLAQSEPGKSWDL